MTHSTTMKKLLMPRTMAVLGTFAGLLAAVALAASAGPAGAVDTNKLGKAGWVCIAPLPVTDELHCIKPGALEQMFSGEAKATNFLVFDSSGEEYLGTEHNIRGDLFHGQPCPTDPPTYEYTHLLPVFGIDYWACHRFDSDHL
jgi:hypothetical protein